MQWGAGGWWKFADSWKDSSPFARVGTLKGFLMATYEVLKPARREVTIAMVNMQTARLCLRWKESFSGCEVPRRLASETSVADCVGLEHYKVKPDKHATGHTTLKLSMMASIVKNLAKSF